MQKVNGGELGALNGGGWRMQKGGGHESVQLNVGICVCT